MASRCRLAASAFVITETMANQLGLRTLLTQPPHAILTASHSHIVENEAGGPAFLSGAMMQCVKPKNGLYLTLQDIQENAVLPDNVHKCPTRVVALENTFSGIVVPLDEMQRISTWCRDKGIKMHLDGARLFESCSKRCSKSKRLLQLIRHNSLGLQQGFGCTHGCYAARQRNPAMSSKKDKKEYWRWNETNRSLDRSSTSRRGRAVWRRRMGI